jgi:hypothetical protein
MIQNARAKTILLLSVFTALLLSGCGSKDQPELSVTLPPDTDSPCDITEEQTEQSVKIAGEIVFVDDTDPFSRYADLEFHNCRIGIMIESTELDTWTPEEKATFTKGAHVIAQGMLDSFPMPARPDEFQLIVELEAPLQSLSALPSPADREDDPSLPDLQGDACWFSDDKLRTPIQVVGEITEMDDSAAAGVYAELKQGNCLVRLWVERNRWETWDEKAQAYLDPGSDVVVDGILTTVLGEHVVDLSYSPRPND